MRVKKNVRVHRAFITKKVTCKYRDRAIEPREKEDWAGRPAVGLGERRGNENHHEARHVDSVVGGGCQSPAERICRAALGQDRSRAVAASGMDRTGRKEG